ncbi:MAG: tetratricopeptide repeat protein [Deltaproteobacteria bacterium]|jgi:tetratricopeptide (TPR) repeat protein|nr:tetratricopeptide repeat protein [Deltaproteobacteria bacterium]
MDKEKVPQADYAASFPGRPEAQDGERPPYDMLAREAAAALALALAGTMAGPGRALLGEDPPGTSQDRFSDALKRLKDSGEWESNPAWALVELADVVRKLCRDEKIMADVRREEEARDRSAGLVLSLRRLASVLDQCDFRRSALGCYRMAHACSVKAGPGGTRPGPLPGFFPGRDGTSVGEDRWKEEASELLDGIRAELAGEFCEGHGNVLEPERIRDMIVRGGWNSGEPDPESRARIGGELVLHLHRQLNAATRQLAVGHNGAAADMFGDVLSTIPLDPDSLSTFEARALAGLGRARFAAGDTDMAESCFDRALGAASEKSCGTEPGEDAKLGDVDVMAAEVGLALVQCARGRRPEAVARLSDILKRIERRVGKSGELAAWAKIVISCRMPALSGA